MDEQLRRHPEYDVAVEEVRVGCTLGMLTCLGRAERLAWILGEILELDHNEAAAIAETTRRLPPAPLPRPESARGLHEARLRDCES